MFVQLIPMNAREKSMNTPEFFIIPDEKNTPDNTPDPPSTAVAIVC